MTRRRTASACVALLIAASLGLAACDDSASDERTEASSNRDRDIKAGDQYVAMGDSYTAGFRTGKTDKDSGVCRRSLNNYPRQVAKKLDLELTDVSCGGATSRDALSPQQVSNGKSVPAQIEAVGKDTDLVTISLGANDIDLYGVVIGTCVKLAQTTPDGSPCADLAKLSDRDSDRDLDAISNKLASTIRTIAAKAPKARVIIVGYPQTFSPNRSCADLPIATGDVKFIYEAARKITAALRTTAVDIDVEYVDLWATTKGHDICSADPWIAGSRSEKGKAFPYHPYAAEQRAVAKLLAAAVSR